MLQEFYLVEYELVGIREIAIEYIQVERSGLPVYSIRIKLYKIENNF